MRPSGVPPVAPPVRQAPVTPGTWSFSGLARGLILATFLRSGLPRVSRGRPPLVSGSLSFPPVTLTKQGIWFVIRVKPEGGAEPLVGPAMHHQPGIVTTAPHGNSARSRRGDDEEIHAEGVAYPRGLFGPVPVFARCPGGLPRPRGRPGRVPAAGVSPAGGKLRCCGHSGERLRVRDQRPWVVISADIPAQKGLADPACRGRLSSP
jgi:hypothetical protein